MNNNDFNNGQPMNNLNTGMGPQPNPNMGVPNMNAQPNPNMGVPNINAQPNPNMGVPNMNAQPNQNMGMPNMNAQPNPNGMPNMGQQYNPNMGMPAPAQKKPMNLPLIIGIVVGVIAIVVIILFATGIIGGKKLTCTQEESYMGMTMKEELIVSFKDDKPSKITTKQTIDYGTNTYYKDIIKEEFDEELEYSKEQGYDANLTSDDTSYTLTVTIGKDDIPSTIDGEETTYENIKKYYEELEYTCK